MDNRLRTPSDSPIKKLLGIGPGLGRYVGPIRAFLASFPDRTCLTLVLIAARIALCRWAAFAATLPWNEIEWKGHRFRAVETPGEALLLLETYLAGIDDRPARQRMMLGVHRLADKALNRRARKASESVRLLEWALASTLPQYDRDHFLALALGCLWSELDRGGTTAERDQVLQDWWTACTHRLAFKDVFTAEIELGEPPPRWPGDDPAHLARVAAWEGMSDSEQRAVVQRHRRRQEDDPLELRSGRVVGRAILGAG